MLHDCSPLFRELPEDVIAQICFLLMPYPVSKGEVIYTAGDTARETFIVHEG